MLFIDAEGSLYSSALYHLRDGIALASTIGGPSRICTQPRKWRFSISLTQHNLATWRRRLGLSYWLPVVACSRAKHAVKPPLTWALTDI